MEIYANNEKAVKKLGWKTERSLDTMLSTAWQWELALRSAKQN
jgi:UDP-glucose 4-epimerase